MNALRFQLGWRDPCGRRGYSKDSTYADLYCYSDADDKISPVNQLASKAFGCSIRGSAVVIRNTPPKLSTFGDGPYPGPWHTWDAPFKPEIPVAELAQTLLFFRDRDATAVALDRDRKRMLASI